MGFRIDQDLCICDPVDDKRLVGAEARFFVDEGEFARLNERIGVVRVPVARERVRFSGARDQSWIVALDGI